MWASQSSQVSTIFFFFKSNTFQSFLRTGKWKWDSDNNTIEERLCFLCAKNLQDKFAALLFQRFVEMSNQNLLHDRRDRYFLFRVIDTSFRTNTVYTPDFKIYEFHFMLKIAFEDLNASFRLFRIRSKMFSKYFSVWIFWLWIYFWFVTSVDGSNFLFFYVLDCDWEWYSHFIIRMLKNMFSTPSFSLKTYEYMGAGKYAI